ncbi:MAG: CheR family methyltransferase [Candidatus Muiribacteriota bacterium]
MKKNNDFNKKEDVIVVGVGASAGGLEALQSFFKNMPLNTKMSFVVVQHLSPDYKSVMDELLGRITKLKIQIAEDGMSILPNNIYLIPPKNNIYIFKNKLFLQKHGERKGLNFPIDIFFRSLAAEKGKNSIGVILSGTGSDGTLGGRAIKEVGGIVMVQDLNSAKFDGMPRNSIATGLVDFVLPSSEMAEALINYIKHPFINKKDNLIKDKQKSLDTISKIIMILREYSGLDFSLYKKNTIIRRLERRVTINGFQKLEDYFNFLVKSDNEKQVLYRELLIGVTRFFRDSDSFMQLKDKVLPKLIENKSIRIWSAGCSTGEEVYSLAILINEFLEQNKLECEVKIFATDVDKNAVSRASEGVYPESVISDIDPVLVSKYFTRKEWGFQANDIIRKKIVFACHNILKDSPFSRLDILVCRNLFIYFKPEVQKRMLSMFYYSLKPAGVLFLGSSESLGEMEKWFKCIDKKAKIYRMNPGFKPEIAGNLLVKSKKTALNPQNINNNLYFKDKFNYDKLYSRILNKMVPPSVVLDENDNILNIINDVSDFLKPQPGNFSQNFFKNLPRELSLFISTILRKLKKGKKKTIFESLISIDKFKDFKITIEGRELDFEHNTFYLISFKKEKVNSVEKNLKNKNSLEIDKDYIADMVELEKELQRTKESLQSTVEELETSNEELQSSNEELVASNEELQSTNEELQSVNEELYTVNNEYQQKIEELKNLNNDMDNLIKNTEVGAVYLDKSMCIRKITPVISDITNILQTDIGRPFSHIIILDDKEKNELILEDVSKVVETLQPVDREIKLRNERTYFLRIRPYRTHVNAVDGILLTFVDISALKKVQKELKEHKVIFEDILQNSPVAQVMVDINGEIIYSNREGERVLGLEKEKVLKRKYCSKEWKITDINGKKLNPDELPFAIIKNTKKELYDFKHYIESDTEKRLLNMSGKPILGSNNILKGVVFTLRVLKYEEKK